MNSCALSFSFNRIKISVKWDASPSNSEFFFFLLPKKLYLSFKRLDVLICFITTHVINNSIFVKRIDQNKFGFISFRGRFDLYRSLKTNCNGAKIWRWAIIVYVICWFEQIWDIWNTWKVLKGEANVNVTETKRKKKKQ